MIYLDNAATSFPKPEMVYLALDLANRNLSFNAGRGGYSAAQAATDAIDCARRAVAKIASCSSSNVAFTPSATIAANILINGLDWTGNKTVYVSPYEHNAIIRPLHYCKCDVKILPFNENHVFDLEKAEMLFSDCPPDYIFATHASNVVGNKLPIEQISELAKVYDSKLFVDVSQTIGVFNLSDCQAADCLIFAGHKNLLGTFGVGGLINNSNLNLNVSISGGNGSDSLNHAMPDKYPSRMEPGSANVVAISSLSYGINWILNKGLDSIQAHKASLIEMLIDGLSNIPFVHVYDIKKEDYSTGVISFVVDDYDVADVGSILNDEFDIAVRTGYHCAPLVHDLLDSKKYGGTVRVSVGCFNTDADILAIINAIRSLEH